LTVVVVIAIAGRLPLPAFARRERRVPKPRPLAIFAPITIAVYSLAMSGWLIVIETSGKEVVSPEEGEAVARPFRDYYAAWFDNGIVALKAVEKRFGAGNAVKAERKMTDEELTKIGLKSVGEIKLLGPKPF